MQKIQKTYKLFLDDIREPINAFAYTRWEEFLKDDWVIVRDYNQFVNVIELQWKENNTFPEIIAFDHDLDDQHYLPQPLWGDDYNKWAEEQNFEEKTGYDCAKWLVDFCIDNDLELPQWYCHSMNPSGRDNINIYLRNFKNKQNG